MKKAFSVLLCLALTLTLCQAAFAYTISGVNEVPVVDEMLTYTIVAPDVTYIEDLNQNSLTQYVAENTNIQLVFETYPDGEYATKVNLLLATEQLPDAFMYSGSVFTSAALADYGGQGLLLPLNDIIEEHGYYVKQIFDEQELLPSAYTSMDGNIYCLPNINECYHCLYSMRAWINGVWLDNLGLEYPNTLDEFVEVLTAFRDKDANGNGDPNDEIPFTGNSNGWNGKVYPFLINSFLHYDESNLAVNPDGTVIFSPLQPEFKEAITFIAGLIADGLIEKEGLTQIDEQFKIKGSNVDAIRLGAFPSACWWHAMPTGDPGDTDLRARDYLPLSPLEGPEGVRISPISDVTVHVGHTVITSACEDPVPLFKMYDWMYSMENTIRANVGELGIDYNLPPEGALGINGKPALYEKIIHDPDWKNFTRMENLWPSNRTSDFRLGEMADYSDPETQWMTEPRLYNSSAEYFAPYADDARYPNVNMTAEEAEQLNFWRTQIDDYTREQIVRFLAGERPLDDWDAFIEEYNNLNLAEYMELRQLSYTRQFRPEQMAERFPDYPG